VSQSCALVTVTSGVLYNRFARDLFFSARQHFRPTESVTFVQLNGREGWPAATMYRPHAAHANLPKTDFVYLIDADMRFEATVGPEILPEHGGITATLHPGFVGKPGHELPFERNPESACYVRDGTTYFCGGFYGGSRKAMRRHLYEMILCIDVDRERGYTPVWHDESAHNRVLHCDPPEVMLDPSYCHPDSSEWYRSWWPHQYERKLVALDKTTAERGER